MVIQYRIGVNMTKKLIQHGNSADLEVVTDGKNIIISPTSAPAQESDLMKALERVNQRHAVTLKKLAE